MTAPEHSPGLWKVLLHFDGGARDEAKAGSCAQGRAARQDCDLGSLSNNRAQRGLSHANPFPSPFPLPQPCLHGELLVTSCPAWEEHTWSRSLQGAGLAQRAPARRRHPLSKALLGSHFCWSMPSQRPHSFCWAPPAQPALLEMRDVTILSYGKLPQPRGKALCG